ncbi:Uncharacterized protein HZ326_3274 [Fusarium oxysporum f. sp. albedinis]|nr:Uncharacterized protein HZ326_3274 [Fusarium oxysporum f. sp. albedinis]
MLFTDHIAPKRSSSSYVLSIEADLPAVPIQSLFFKLLISYKKGFNNFYNINRSFYKPFSPKKIIIKSYLKVRFSTFRRHNNKMPLCH